MGGVCPRPALTGDPRPRVAERAAARSREASRRTEPLGICKGRGGGRRRGETGLPPQGARRAGLGTPTHPCRCGRGSQEPGCPGESPARGGGDAPAPGKVHRQAGAVERGTRRKKWGELGGAVP